MILNTVIFKNPHVFRTRPSATSPHLWGDDICRLKAFTSWKIFLSLLHLTHFSTLFKRILLLPGKRPCTTPLLTWCLLKMLYLFIRSHIKHTLNLKSKHDHNDHSGHKVARMFVYNFMVLTCNTQQPIHLSFSFIVFVLTSPMASRVSTVKW